MGDSEIIKLLEEYISYSEKTKRSYVTIEVDVLKNALNIICQKEALERANILNSSLQETLSEMLSATEKARVEAINEFWQKLKEKKFHEFFGEGCKGYLIRIEDGENIAKEMIGE